MASTNGTSVFLLIVSVLKFVYVKVRREYAYNQSYAMPSAVLPDMGQAEKERGESHEWGLMIMLPV